MKHIHIIVNDNTFNKISKIKGKRTWRELMEFMVIDNE